MRPALAEAALGSVLERMAEAMARHQADMGQLVARCEDAIAAVVDPEGLSTSSVGRWTVACSATDTAPGRWRWTGLPLRVDLRVLLVLRHDHRDPFTRYAKAVRQLVPHARLVVDKFHVLRLFARAVDQVRRRTIRQAEGRRGRKVDLMWRTRMLLLKRYERLTVEQEERVMRTIRQEDYFGEVTAAYMARDEDRRRILNA